MLCHAKSHVRVFVHGDGFTFAAKESELRRVRSKMSEWYDIEARASRGKRNVRETEILGRNVRWTDEGLECEASDKHRQVLMEEMTLCKESNDGQTVQQSSLKAIGREEHGEMLEGTEKTSCTKIANPTRTLEHIEQIMKMTRGDWGRWCG